MCGVCSETNFALRVDRAALRPAKRGRGAIPCCVCILHFFSSCFLLTLRDSLSTAESVMCGQWHRRCSQPRLQLLLQTAYFALASLLSWHAALRLQIDDVACAVGEHAVGMIYFLARVALEKRKK